MKQWQRFTIFLILLVSILACSKKVVVTKYYVLDNSDTSGLSIHKNSPLPYTVEIRNLRINLAYSQERIVARMETNEISYYYYHKWAESPAEAIRSYLWKKIKLTNLFKSCVMGPANGQADFAIIGYIDKIERIDQEDKYATHLKMKIEFIEQNTNEIIVTHTFDRIIALEESSSMNLFASNISKILDEETALFLDKIKMELTGK
jgi:ABC-type uncharacterized transport system auxiliary subunit